METYYEIIANLEDELAKTETISSSILDQADFAIGHCKIALDYLREHVKRRGFPDKESEILFFKKMKPSVYSKLLYYQGVFNIESVRLEIDRDGLKAYFQQKLKGILAYMKERKVKVQYYRCGHTYLDEKYFLRDNKEIPLELKDSRSIMDEEFFTWHDHTFSTIMANEMLIEYIKKQMEKLDHSGGHVLPKSKLRWTGNKIDLYEIIYSLYFAGSVNDGKATIKEITEGFERMYNIELQKEIYKTQDQLIKRADPVKFLARLIEILRRRINGKLG